MARDARQGRVGALAVAVVLVGVLTIAVAESAGQTRPDPDQGQAQSQGRTVPAAGAGTTTAAPVAHVRGVKAGVHDGAKLVADSTRTCPSIRRLLEALEGTDVIVFVEVRDGVANGRAQLTMMGSRAGVRWLRVTVDARHMWRQQVAFLAHELRHTVEVAMAPEVRDVAGFLHLYERIGYSVGGGRFETAAAVAAENEALRELAGMSPRRGPSKEGNGVVHR
jgi:hypothetical protein